MRCRVVAVLILIATAASVGCASDQPPTAPSVTADPAPHQALDLGLDLDGDPLPMDSILIALLGTTDTQYFSELAAAEAAEIVKECMGEAGFEFVIPPAEPIRTEADVRATQEWAEVHGFGVVDRFLARLEVEGLVIPQPDRNREYLGTLTAAEIERFLATLYGPEPDPGQLRTDTGCTGAADAEVNQQWYRLLETIPSFTSLAETRDTHPGWVAARRAWEACMSDRGYDYGEPESVETDVSRRLDELIGEEFPSGRLPLVEQAGAANGLVIDPGVVPLLDRVRQFEIDAALANFDCTEQLADAFDAVESEIQVDFVEKNRTAIEDLLAP